MIYWCLTATTFPFDSDMKQVLGNYRTEKLAQEACKFLRKFNSNVDYHITQYDGHAGALCDKLDKNEYRRLLDLELRVGQCESLTMTEAIALYKAKT